MIRPYRPGDSSKISTFLTTPQYNRDLQFWVWLNRVLPEQESMIYVADNNGMQMDLEKTTWNSLHKDKIQAILNKELR